MKKSKNKGTKDRFTPMRREVNMVSAEELFYP